jgi:hypothetical protein
MANMVLTSEEKKFLVLATNEEIRKTQNGLSTAIGESRNMKNTAREGWAAKIPILQKKLEMLNSLSSKIV